MKNQKHKKLINILIIIILIIMFLTPTIFATDIIANDFKPGTPTGTNKITEKGGLLLGYVRITGSVIAVVILTAIGIKYMYGSVEEKAEYKKSMMPYLIGAVLLFGSSNLIQIIYDIMTTVNNS
jgi:type IV secretory pathway VirB2 component (pilin)